MKKGVIANRIQKFLSGLKLECLAEVVRESSRLGKLDAGILQVAMMVSALDGHVTEDELQTFEKLAKKCRGYNAESAKAVFREGLKAAGYIELAARTLSAKELLALFADETGVALPDGFAYGDAKDVRRAFVMWTAMAMSDDEYAPVERKAVGLLADRVRAQIQKRRDANFRRQSLSPAFAAAFREKNGDANVLPNDFFKQAEQLIAKFKRDTSAPAAMAQLKKLIDNA